MKYNINIDLDLNEELKKDKKINQLIEELSILYLKETFKGNKVSYYYEDINSSTKLSFNKSICFYAASSIKMLVCLILFEMTETKQINLEEKVLVSMDELKQ